MKLEIIDSNNFNVISDFFSISFEIVIENNSFSLIMNPEKKIIEMFSYEELDRGKITKKIALDTNLIEIEIPAQFIHKGTARELVSEIEGAHILENGEIEKQDIKIPCEISFLLSINCIILNTITYYRVNENKSISLFLSGGVSYTFIEEGGDEKRIKIEAKNKGVEGDEKKIIVSKIGKYFDIRTKKLMRRKQDFIVADYLVISKN